MCERERERERGKNVHITFYVFSIVVTVYWVYNMDFSLKIGRLFVLGCNNLLLINEIETENFVS